MYCRVGILNLIFLPGYFPVVMSDDIKSVTSDLSTRSGCTGAARPPRDPNETSISSISNPTIQKGRHHPDVYSITSTPQSHTCSDLSTDRSQSELFSGSVCTQDPIQLCALTSSPSSNSDHGHQSCGFLTKKDEMQGEEPSDCFDLQSSSLSSAHMRRKAVTGCPEKAEEDSDLQLSDLKAGESSRIGLHSSLCSTNPLQSKVMRELSLSWKKKVENEERIARALTIPCTGPYHRLYGMSRITAQDNTQRKILIVESRTSLPPFTLYLCDDHDSESSKIIVVAKHATAADNNAIELWGPWSTFACGVYFRQYFNLSSTQEPPRVMFNPISVTGMNIKSPGKTVTLVA